jgi:alkylation response protein AidB-like acyl-CoA dehydrogenase
MNALTIDDEAKRADALKDAANDLVSTLSARADETEELRHLPIESFNDLRALGLTRLGQPRAFGGAELPLDRAVDILSVLAQGCASSAWVCGVYTDHAILAGMFDEQAAKEVWEATPEAAISAGYFPVGKAERVDGGWQLSGKWGWVSGCDYADWFLFGAFLPGKDGGPVHHFFLVPRSEIEIEDNWHVLGLRGTGSKNVIVAGAFVPEHRVLSFPEAKGGAEARGNQESRALYRLGHVSSVPFVFAAVALGVTESLLSIMTEQISNRQAMGQNLRELQSMQLHIAESAAELDCARLLMMRDTSEAMAAMRERRPLTMLERGRNRRDMAYLGQLCKSAGNRLHEMAGASGIFDSHITQRKYRDLQAATRHITLSWDIAGTTYGEIRYGLEPSSPLV